MPLFRYQAIDRAGRPVVGTMKVTDETALTRRLAEMGYRPTTIERHPGSNAPQKAHLPAAGRADSRSLALFYRHLAVSLKAGISPYQALTRLTGGGSALAAAVPHLAAEVEQGGSLAAAMERFPALFPPGATGLVRAAELGGFLDRAFALLADQAEQDYVLGRAVRPWTWYLGLTGFAALFLTLPVAAFMRPAIAGGLEAGLRAYGRALLTQSLPVALLVVLLILALRVMAGSPSVRPGWHALLLRLPILGRLARLRSRAAFVETLTLLYHAGVAPPQAWRAAAAAAPNVALATRLQAALPVLEGGGTYSQAMRQPRLFPEVEIQMVATGETTGEIEEMLGRLANDYHQETAATLQQIPTLVRVPLLLVAGVITLVALYVAGRGYVEGLIQGVDDYFASP